MKARFFAPTALYNEVYRLEKRRTKRTQICISLVLITVLLQDGRPPMPSQILTNIMKKLWNVLCKALRCGDVVTQYSGMQYAIILPECDLNRCRIVEERIRSAAQAENLPGMIRLEFDAKKL